MRIMVRVAIIIGTLSILSAFLGCSRANPPTAASIRSELDNTSTPTINVSQTAEAIATENAEVAKRNEADRKTAIAEFTPEPTATQRPDAQVETFARRTNELAKEFKTNASDLNDVLPTDPELRGRAEELAIRAWDMCLEIIALSQDVGEAKIQSDRMIKVRDRVAILDHSCRSDDDSDRQNTPIRVLIAYVMRSYDLRTWDEEPPTSLSNSELNPGPQEFYLDYATLMGGHPEALDINNGNFLVYYHGRIVEIFNLLSKENPIYNYRIALFGRDDEVVMAKKMPTDCGTHKTKNGFSNEYDLCHYWPEVGDLVRFTAEPRGQTTYVSAEAGDPRIGDRLDMEAQMGFYDDLPGDTYTVPLLVIWEIHRIHQMHHPDVIMYAYRFENGKWSTLNEP